MRAGLQRSAQTGLRMTHAQQQIEYPGDMGFEYTEALVNNPIIWFVAGTPASGVKWICSTTT